MPLNKSPLLPQCPKVSPFILLKFSSVLMSPTLSLYFTKVPPALSLLPHWVLWWSPELTQVPAALSPHFTVFSDHTIYVISWAHLSALCTLPSLHWVPWSHNVCDPWSCHHTLYGQPGGNDIECYPCGRVVNTNLLPIGCPIYRWAVVI